MVFLMYLILILIAVFPGILPAYIAKSKGHSFWKWWLYGWMLFGISIIHVMFISDLTGPEQQRTMVRKGNGHARIYSLLAGLCFLITGYYAVIHGVLNDWITEPIEMLYCAALLAFAIMLLVGRRNKGVLVVAVFFALLELPNVRFGIYGVFGSYGAVFLAVLTAGSVLPSLRKNAVKMIKKTWFLPAIYFLLDFTMLQLGFLSMGMSYFNAIWETIFMKFFKYAGFFLMGLWLQAFSSEELLWEPEPAAVIYTESHLNTQTGVSEVEGALHSYQSLVNSGIMTKMYFGINSTCNYGRKI